MAVILLSGGLDSTLNLALAARAGKARLALSVDYGQRAATAELGAARALAAHYRAPWRSVDLRWLGEVNPTLLTRAGELPRLERGELDSAPATQASMKAVWVANRNGVLLNVAAAFAEALGDTEILAGFNREEAASFPDNSRAFLEASNGALAFSTLNGVRASSYTLDMDKSGILREALACGLPLDLVWSCYESGPQRCWRCESCLRTERALLAAGEAGRSWLVRMGGRP